MTDYKRPGTYIQESLTPLVIDTGTPGASRAAFVGTHTQGPVLPAVISSWAQFVQLYGGFGTATDYLPYAVYQFFNNGGSTCYVVRAVASDAVTAATTLNDTAGTPHAILTVSALSPGVWANSYAVEVVPGGSGVDHFTLLVLNSAGTVVERYIDVSPNPADSRHVVNIVNSAFSGSNLISVAYVFSGTYVPATNALAAVSSPQSLSTGADGVATPSLLTAAQLLASVGTNLDLNLPGVTSTTTLNSVVSWAAGVGNIFVVIDTPQLTAPITSASATSAYTGYAVTQSSYAAIYGPWLNVVDPSSSSIGASRLLPPGGAVLGQYAITDVTRGTQKAAAGIGNVIKGVLSTEVTLVNTDLDTLNVAGINIIKSVPGAGFCIMGARTTQPGLPSQYVSTRRTLMRIENSLINLTRFAIFEPNGPVLWSTLSAVCGQYLTGLMQSGALQGTTQQTSYFVECDATNNPPTSVANGYVYIDVGVALLSPAEFIVIRIGQYEGGSSATQTSS